MEPTIKILIVDDAPYFRQAVRKLFDDQPTFKVVGEAGNGLEALDLVSIWQPHVVLLDYALPVMNGLDTAKKIKERFPETQIVLLSMFSEEVKDQAARVGACLCIGKDADLRELPSMIEGCYLSTQPTS